MKGVQPPETAEGRTRSWWAAVLAGQVDDPHPLYGANLDVAFKGGVLHLSGELPSEDDRQRLLEEAGEVVGRGVDAIDAKHLRVARRKEKPGILDQTLIAAFENRDVAEFARRYMGESRRIEPKLLEILDAGQEDMVRELVPTDFMSDVEKVCQRVAVIRKGEIVTIEEVEKLRQKAGQRVTVEFGDAVSPDDLSRIPGVSMVTSHNHAYHFNVGGSMDALIKALSRHEVLRLQAEEAPLEEVFLKFYENPQVETTTTGTR